MDYINPKLGFDAVGLVVAWQHHLLRADETGVLELRRIAAWIDAFDEVDLNNFHRHLLAKIGSLITLRNHDATETALLCLVKEMDEKLAARDWSEREAGNMNSNYLHRRRAYGFD